MRREWRSVLVIESNVRGCNGVTGVRRAAAQDFVTAVDYDGAEPCAQRGLPAKSCERARGADPGFLYGVFGVGWTAAGEAQREHQQRRCVRAVELAEAHFVAGAKEPGDQFLIVRDLRLLDSVAPFANQRQRPNTEYTKAQRARRYRACVNDRATWRVPAQEARRTRRYKTGERDGWLRNPRVPPDRTN